MIIDGKAHIFFEEEEWCWATPHHLTLIQFNADFESWNCRILVDAINNVCSDKVFIHSGYDLVMALSKEDATAILLHLPQDDFDVLRTFESVLHYHKES